MVSRVTPPSSVTWLILGVFAPETCFNSDKNAVKITQVKISIAQSVTSSLSKIELIGHKWVVNSFLTKPINDNFSLTLQDYYNRVMGWRRIGIWQTCPFWANFRGFDPGKRAESLGKYQTWVAEMNESYPYLFKNFEIFEIGPVEKKLEPKQVERIPKNRKFWWFLGNLPKDLPKDSFRKYIGKLMVFRFDFRRKNNPHNET